MPQTPGTYQTTSDPMRLPTFAILFLFFQTLFGNRSTVTTSARIEFVSILVPDLSP